VGASKVVSDGWGWRFGANPSLGITGGSFTIAPGERVLLLGPSGCGKSTLLRALAGVLGDDEGISTGSLSLSGSSPSASRGRVGLVLQDPESQAVLERIGDDVAFGCENLGVPPEDTWRRVHAALSVVGLNYPLTHSTSHLSGGEKQRLALAGALAMQPDLLLLDEPTANLDSVGALAVRDAVLTSVRETGATLIVVEHNVNLWWEHVDRVIVMDAQGNFALDATPTEVLARASAQLAAWGIWLPTWHSPIVHIGLDPESRIGRDPALLSAEKLQVGLPRHNALTWSANLSIEPGSFHALTGPNGSGKTTLALTLGGLIKPVSGALLAATELAQTRSLEPYRWSSRQLARRVGNVFQSPEMQFVKPTVWRELAHGAKLRGLRGAELDTAVGLMLERVGLSDRAQAHPFTLSGGQQRRLSVATALISQPRVLVLDEPTFGQDARTWGELIAMFDELTRSGHAIVAATHDERLIALAGRETSLVRTQVENLS